MPKSKTIKYDDDRFDFDLPILLPSKTLLATPQTGMIEFDDDRFYITSVNTQRTLDRSSCVVVETVTVENTTTETTLFTCPMPANSIKEANLFKFIGVGIASNSSASDVLTIRVKVGGNTIVTVENSARTFSDDDVHLNGMATQRTIGVSGSRAAHFDLEIGGDGAVFDGIGTIDTTANMDLVITAQWNNAKAGNTLAFKQGILEFKN